MPTLDELKKTLKDEHKIDVDSLIARDTAFKAVETNLAAVDKDLKLAEVGGVVKSLRDSVAAKDKEINALKTSASPEVVKLSEQVKTYEKTNETLTTQLAASNDRITAMEKASKKAIAEAKVDTLVKEGKLRPADKATYLELAEASPEQFDKIAKTLPKVVTLGENGVSTAEPNTGGMTETQIQENIDRIAKEQGLVKTK